METQEEDEDQDVLVWRSNGRSLDAFCACETQWRSAAGLAGLIWLGLDYAAVDVVLRRLDCPPSVFFDVRVMEAAALDAFGEAAGAEADR